MGLIAFPLQILGKLYRRKVPTTTVLVGYLDTFTQLGTEKEL